LGSLKVDTICRRCREDGLAKKEKWIYMGFGNGSYTHGITEQPEKGRGVFREIWEVVVVTS